MNGRKGQESYGVLLEQAKEPVSPVKLCTLTTLQKFFKTGITFTFAFQTFDSTGQPTFSPKTSTLKELTTRTSLSLSGRVL